MTDKAEKPAIPAWQQARTTNSDTPSTSPEDATPLTPPPPVEDTLAAVAKKPEPPQIDEKEQREQIRVFLRDPGVRDESIEKKRDFLKSKDMPTHLVEEVLSETSAVKFGIDTTDFDAFKGQVAATSASAPAPSSELEEHPQAAPPIITYPEFLANAHRAPPLITPARILATTYVASAAALLTYAASTFLVKPMIASLTDARHELATHSGSKIDELNARLEKIVSEVPSKKSDKKEGDSDSVASDPTELFSQDAGTQTEQGAQAEHKVTIFEPTTSAKHAEQLAQLQKHLDDIVSSTKSEGKAVEEREDRIKKLRHYLDSLSYGGSGLNVWSNTGGQFGWEKEQQREKDKKDDPIEELKREIRGVKGVLLSAKRFPAAGKAPNGSGISVR